MNKHKYDTDGMYVSEQLFGCTNQSHRVLPQKYNRLSIHICIYKCIHGYVYIFNKCTVHTEHIHADEYMYVYIYIYIYIWIALNIRSPLQSFEHVRLHLLAWNIHPIPKPSPQSQ